MTDASAVDHYAIYIASHDGQYTKKKMIGITGVNSAYLNGLPAQQNVPLVIEALDAGGNVISNNKVLLKTTFKPMNDSSK